MSRTLRASALFALLLIIPAVPAAAASPIIDASQDKGRNAYADTYTCSRVGDVETCEYVSASVSVGRSRYNGESFKGTTLCAGTGTDTYDYSDGSGSWTSRYGCLEDADASIARDLSAASGQGAIPTEEQSCSWDGTGDEECTDPVPAGNLNVDLDWTAVGSARSSRDRYVFSSENCTDRWSSRGTSVEASVEGTLEGGAADFEWAEIGEGQSKYTFSCRVPK